MAKKRMAWETAHYLGIPNGEAEAIHLLGVGIKSLNRSPAPKSVTDAYIHEKNASPAITGYENSFALSYDDVADDAAVQALQRVADDQLTGEDAEFYYYRVDLLGAPVDGAYPARRYRVVCEAGEETSEAAGVVSAGCTLRQVGGLQKGTFSTAAKTFAPEAGQ